jgi:hypothetical protein
MDVNAVAEELAARLDTIAGLRVYPEPEDQISPPAAVVTYPDVTFDGTYGRGMDRMTFPVVIAVKRVNARVSRKQIDEFVSGAGPRSVKAVVESGSYDSFDTVRVVSAEFDVASIGAVEYLICTFTLEITGQGA